MDEDRAADGEEEDMMICGEMTLLKAMIDFKTQTGVEISGIRLTKEQAAEWTARYAPGNDPSALSKLSPGMVVRVEVV